MRVIAKIKERNKRVYGFVERKISSAERFCQEMLVGDKRVHV
jgi:hypothetical protein